MSLQLIKLIAIRQGRRRRKYLPLPEKQAWKYAHLVEKGSGKFHSSRWYCISPQSHIWQGFHNKIYLAVNDKKSMLKKQ